jgi:hypothetical protein
MNKNLVQQSMPIFEGKKVLNVGVKVNEEMRQELEAIAAAEDRPMSYVVRELAVRGLALYKQDGRLKATEAEENILQTANEITPAKGQPKEPRVILSSQIIGETTDEQRQQIPRKRRNHNHK